MPPTISVVPPSSPLAHPQVDDSDWMTQTLPLTSLFLMVVIAVASYLRAG